MLGQYFDILVLLVVVAVIFYRLRSVLGISQENNKEKRKITEENAAKIFDLLMKEAEQKQLKINLQSNVISEKSSDIDLSETDKILQNIPNFDKNRFLNSAKRAFEVIVEAFAKGDVSTLEMLVNKNLLKKFQDVWEQRRIDGVVAETDFICFNNAEIVDVKISSNNVAKIIVKFVSEQVNLLKNKQGDVIEGDDRFIQCITDIWTFERTLTSSNPNWLLVSTKK